MQTLSNQKTSGFTLIESAIAIMIIGILLAAATVPYSLYRKRLAYQTTNENIATISTMLGSYRMLNGHYPCPAPLTSARTDPKYGHADTDCAAPLLAAGNCAGGMVAGSLCIQTSNRVVNGVNPRVAVGTIPFRELNIDENQSFDGYNNRIFYAVTEDLAAPGKFSPDIGGIEILNQTNQSALATSGSAHFFVFSAGEDGTGAYSREGVRTSACPAFGTTMEADNCSLGAQAIYKQAATSKATGANRYDDIATFFTAADMPLWEMSANNSVDIRLRPGGNLGASLSSQDTISYKTQIQGITHMTANMMAQDLCKSGNINECFPTSLITGPTGLSCPAGQFMDYVSQGAPHCTAEVFYTCATGKILKGINADGSANCVTYTAPPASCGSYIGTLCAPNDVLIGGTTTSGTSVTKVAPGGGNRTGTYLCTNGAWSQTSVSGSCTCPLPTISQQPCPTGFTGTQTVTVTTNCPLQTTTSISNKATACVCNSNYQVPNTVQCTGSLSGSWTQYATMNCATGVLGPYLPATMPAGACTCAQPQTIPGVCPNGNLTPGNPWTQTRQPNCTTGGWYAYLPATPPAGSCTCDPTKTQAGPSIPCPAGYAGTGTPTIQTLQCPNGTWGTAVANGPANCQPVYCYWKSNSSPSTGNARPSGPLIGTQCACGSAGPCSASSGGSYNNYQSCTCQ